MIIKELKNISLELRKDRSPLAPTAVFHLSELEKIGKNSGNRNTTEDEAIQYIKKAIQKQKENPKPSDEELKLLQKLLPSMASREEISKFLETLPSDQHKGQIMGAVKKKFGAKVDMKMVSDLIG